MRSDTHDDEHMRPVDIQWESMLIDRLTNANLTHHISSFVKHGTRASDFPNLQEIMHRMKLPIAEQHSFRVAIDQRDTSMSIEIALK